VLATCNLGSIDPGPLAHAVAGVFLGSRMTAERATPAGTPPARGAAGATGAVVDPLPYLGEYYSADLDVAYRVTRADGGGLVLHMPRRAPQALEPDGQDRFRGGAMRLRFDRDAGTGTAGSLVIEASRLGSITFVKRRDS
jgi:hypothetical protein